MKIRNFIFGFLLVCLGLPVLGQNVVTHHLTAWTTGQHTLWDGNSVEYWGFGKGFLKPPVFPGPTLYANEGDSVVVNLRNQSQGAPHTIHWHGLDVNQANDGFAPTSFAFPHLMDSSYYFRVPHAGTYLYHCHIASVLHVQMGMYGVFIVRPADGSQKAWTNGPAFHMERSWLMSEIDKSWHDNPPKHNTLDSLWSNFNIPAYEPDYFLVNGISHQQLADSGTAIYGQAYMDIYLRLSNVGFLLNDIRFPASLNAEIISSDGRPLPQAMVQDTLRIAPGERYGVMLHPITEFTDSIMVSFLNMNTMQANDTQWVAVDINGFVSSDPPNEPEPTFQIFPNPSDGNFHLSWHGFPKGKGQVELYNMNGMKLRSFSHNFVYAGSHFFGTKGLPKGIYLVKVKLKHKEFSRKVIVQ